MRAARWRLVVRRSIADRLIVVAAWLVILAAATLLSAGVMYSEAVARSGLQRVLLQAPPIESNVQISLRVAAPDVDAVDATVTREVERVFGALDAPIVRASRSGSYELPNQLAGETTRLTVLASAEGIESRAALVVGTWPLSGTVPISTAVSEAAARQLDVAVGDTLMLRDRRDSSMTLTVVIDGLYRIADPADPYWWADPLDLQGSSEDGSFTTLGPLIVTRDDLIARTSGSRAALTWRVFPDLADLGVDRVRPIGSGVAGLQSRLEDLLPDAFAVEVETQLPDILARASSSLLVSGSGVLLLDLQLAVLAGYALLLVAGLIIDQRRSETALFRSRGAAGQQLAGLAVREGLVLVVPAVAIGPVLAFGVLALVERGGPLAAIGVPLEPRMSETVFVVTLGAALASLVGLVLPAVVSSGPLASIRRSVGRQLQRTMAQRLGLDIALVVLAAIGLWQLQRYGAPITRSLRGSLGVDPLLVAAPALGLLAGAVVALRLVPILARGLEEASARRNGLVSHMGTRQLSRRPLRYTRAALLLMVAAAIGVFASAYEGTWQRSQRDQVDHAVGSDVRVISGPLERIPAWAVASAYRQTPGVEAQLAITAEELAVGTSDTGGELRAIDPEAGRLIAFRPDLADEPLEALLRRLAADRPVAELAPLPGEPERVAVDVQLDLQATAAEDHAADLPVGWPGLTVAVVTRDPSGAVQRSPAGRGTLDAGTGRIIVPLTMSLPGGLEASPRLPLDLLGIELTVDLPPTVAVTGSIAVSALAVSEEPAGEAWQPVPFPPTGSEWEAVRSQPLEVPVPIPRSQQIPGGAEIRSESSIAGPDEVTIGLRPRALMPNADRPPLAAIVNDAFLSETAARVGDELSVGARFADPRPIRIAGAIRGFPTLSTDEPFVILDRGALALHDYAERSRTLRADEWWLQVPGDRASSLAPLLGMEPFGGDEVLVRAEQLQARLTDPIAVGVIGALSIGSAAALIFAAIGFVVSTMVAARERLSEFALMRALGLSTRQLSAWLTLENAFLLSVSLVAGVGLGALLSWVVLPSVTLTPDATTVVPPVHVVAPWDVVIVLAGLGVASLAVTVAVLTRVLGRVSLSSVLRGTED